MNLEKVKQELAGRQSAILNRVGKLMKDKNRSNTEVMADFEERASLFENDEVVDGLDEASRKELAQIREALKRIENGNYGVCMECGEEISSKRLLAVPYAVRCMECEQND